MLRGQVLTWDCRQRRKQRRNMIIEIKKQDTFVPEWNGNHKLSEEERIEVDHRFLKPGERKKFVHLEPMELDYSGDKPQTKTRYVQDVEGLTRAIIVNIRNLVIKHGDKEIVIDTSDKLYNTEGIPQELVSEIEGYMLNASPEVDKDFLS